MKLHTMLERLAEMFPKQDYSSRLERYLKEKKPDSISQIESLSREFETSQKRTGTSL